ncbi:MAG: winged helix-turn-helix transcriptional regulator [Alphaproteobacteria bacterium]|nr:winged helix-turn-helix transcriptional regulator [Alphaproteobacteria bacterium]
MHPTIPIQILIQLVRQNFQLLKNVTDMLHQPISITAAMRAVMEHISQNGPQTVPQIARSKLVTRQHIQQIVDILISRGLTATNHNQHHRRSPIIDFTSAGRNMFRGMQNQEEKILQKLQGAMDDSEVTQAITALSHLKQNLEKLTHHSKI